MPRALPLLLLLILAGPAVVAQPDSAADAPADAGRLSRPAVEASVSLANLDPDRRRELKHLLEDLRDPDLALDRRRRAAAILLDRDWRAATRSVRRLLIGGAHRSTLRAIAQAVAEAESPEPELVPALLKLLRRDEAELRRDVAAALGRFDSDDLRRRLIELATSPANPEPLRLGAIRALAEHRTQSAAKALLDVAETGTAAERRKALDALAQLTGLQEFGDDLEAWKRWWSRARGRSEQQWLTMLMRNLSARNAQVLERLREVKDRVVEAHQQLYNATAESGRTTMIRRLLDDPMPELRLLALRLIDRRLLNAQPISDSVRQAMRRRLTDESADVRARTAQLLENLADARGARIASDLLLAEFNVRVQARFLSLLARVPRAEAVPPALLLIERPELRGPAAALLVAADRAGMLQQKQARRALAVARQRLNNADQPEPEMLRLVGRLGGESDQSLLVDHLDHEATSVRVAAAEALAAGDKWPLDPLLDHADDPALRSLIFEAAARRGSTPEVVERLLPHEPDSSETRDVWVRALQSITARLDRAGIRRVHALLAERSREDELHERVLQAAAGLAEGAQSGGNGSARRADEPAAWVAAALCLGDLYRSRGRFDRAERVYETIREEAPLQMLDVEQRQRLAIGRLKLLLASDRPIAAEAHTRNALTEQEDAPIDTLAECWLEAVRSAKEADRADAAKELARRTRKLFEGHVAAQAVLRSDALRTILEQQQTGNSP